MPNLFVGSDEDYKNVSVEHPEITIDLVVHACKEPYHRQFVGYTGRACDKEHPEYLRANRGNEVALNLVDAKESKYFDFALIEKIVDQMCTMLGFGKTILLHCNQGQSRGPGLAMLVLASYNRLPADFEAAVLMFKQLYPEFEPGEGMIKFIEENWAKFYVKPQQDNIDAMMQQMGIEQEKAEEAVGDGIIIGVDPAVPGADHSV